MSSPIEEEVESKPTLHPVMAQSCELARYAVRIGEAHIGFVVKVRVSTGDWDYRTTGTTTVWQYTPYNPYGEVLDRRKDAISALVAAFHREYLSAHRGKETK